MKTFLLGMVVSGVLTSVAWYVYPRAEPPKPQPVAVVSPVTPEVQQWFTENLKDPGSLQIVSVEHGISSKGDRKEIVKFRARNGFGGYDLQTFTFDVTNGVATPR